MNLLPSLATNLPAVVLSGLAALAYAVLAWVHPLHNGEAFGLQHSDGRGDDPRFLITHAAFFARMRVQRSHGDAGVG